MKTCKQCGEKIRKGSGAIYKRRLLHKRCIEIVKATELADLKIEQERDRRVFDTTNLTKCGQCKQFNNRTFKCKRGEFPSMNDDPACSKFEVR